MEKRETKVLLLCAVFMVTAAFITAGAVYSQQGAPKKEKDSCITSSCHAAFGKDNFVHGPVAAGECTICHGKLPQHKDNPKRNKFQAIKEVAKLCYSCHEKFMTKKYIHKPVEDGECNSCHSPHGSPNKFQLLGKGGELCFNCHDEKIVGGKFVHGPAAVGGCTACHDPHTADFEKNLKAGGADLCFLCHTDKAEIFSKSEVKHKPITESCTPCHNPHSEEKQYMLKAGGTPLLCFGCHKDKKEQVDTASVQHGALTADRTCLNCHDAHVSGIAKMLLLPPMDLCIKCHEHEYKRADGSVLADIRKLLAENSDHHGPIKQKDCSGCHNPHGSNTFRILRYPYPSTFYAPFYVDNYNLCFSCHEKTIVLNPETTKLTNFRNGDVNLHFTHVNKPEKGRTCRACHETHASNHPKHIRESVPFGTWELPVNYQKTGTGGSCTPGCHKIKKYDREKKQENL